MGVISFQRTNVGGHGDTPLRADLRAGVVRAIESLGTSFLTHGQNRDLRRKLESNELTAEEYARQLIRVVYRFLFLFLAEERGLLHPPEAGAVARARYEEGHSVGRLRALAAAMPGTDSAGLWHSLSRVAASLSRAEGCRELGLPGLGSFLWSSRATPDLLDPVPPDQGRSVLIRDRDVLDAVRALCGLEPDRAGVEFREVGSGQLGSVYESLLELRPRLDIRTGTFSLCKAAGNERKTSGAFYTPDSLIQHVLDSALDPVIDERLERASARATAAGGPVVAAQEEAILGISVCDPACGSGHFLVAAAHRLAHRLAVIRTGSLAPGSDQHQAALREIISRCLYGVDLNPMAAELCRLALWLESNDPGRPLPVLEARIRVGNALLGATPELIGRGIPDEAFQTLTGDVPGVVRYFKKRNAQERRDREANLSGGDGEAPTARALNCPVTDKKTRLLADAWCAAFVWRKHDTDRADALPDCPGAWDAITGGVLDAMREEPDSVHLWMREEVGRLAAEHSFFHWHLEFPDVFGGPGNTSSEEPPLRAHSNGGSCRVASGFDVVLGNPPFLNQLETTSATERGLAAIIRQRTDSVIRGYTDLSATFLLLATQLVRSGGRVTLVQPQSLLAAKDASAVRAAVLRLGALSSLWVSNEHVFPGANVFTCAPTLHIGGPRRGPLNRSATGRFVPLDPITINSDALSEEETWAHLVAVASGVPEVTIRSAGVFGDLADATADFRDQYYGLKGFVVEDAELTPTQRAAPGAFPPIVTTGLIDLAECRWGSAQTRLFKRSWRAPRVDRERMEAEGTLGGWLAARLVPKLLLATQTRIIEVIVDGAGDLVPSVPVVTITPHDPSRLWHLAAAIASPVCTAIACRRYAGAALNADAIKLSAKQVLKLLLPRPSRQWNAAAEHLRAASMATDRASRLGSLHEMAIASVGAYGVPSQEAERLVGWWCRRSGSHAAPTAAQPLLRG